MDRVCRLVHPAEVLWTMHWSMDGDVPVGPPDPASAEAQGGWEWDEDGEEQVKRVPITPAQLNTVVHPSGRWILCMEFDARATGEGSKQHQVIKDSVRTSRYHITREELCEPTATLRQVRGRQRMQGQGQDALRRQLLAQSVRSMGGTLQLS